jgi:hypothetical protein
MATVLSRRLLLLHYVRHRRPDRMERLGRPFKRQVSIIIAPDISNVQKQVYTNVGFALFFLKLQLSGLYSMESTRVEELGQTWHIERPMQRSLVTHKRCLT